MRHLEELAANAWPGLRSVLVDGWILRFADGYSRRANSVLPLAEGTTSLPSRIARCEALAELEGAEPTFKLFPEARPEGLDAELERRGYAKQACTSVMTLDAIPERRSSLPAGIRPVASRSLTERWFSVYAENGALNARKAAAARAIMEHIVPDRCFLLLEDETGPAACALAVIEDGWAGIFDVVVRKDLRRRGLGRALMEHTLAEAATRGARRSYLQVMDENRPAINLYLSMGYRVAYPYWYRVKETRP